MKKFLLTLLVVSLLVIPFRVEAGTKKVLGDSYNTKNFVEALEDEEIEKEFSKYSENSDQITIYLFRGKGCSFCRAYLTFMNSITKEYGKYFKMVSFEVWNDEQNWNLMSRISYYLDEEVAGGVPYIIIGDKVFPGYASQYDDEIKKAIVDLYNTPKKDRYDVFEHAEEDGLITMEELEELYASEEGENGDGTAKAATSSSSDSVSNKAVILWNLLFVAVGTGAVIAFTYFYNKNKFEELEDKLSSRKSYKEDNEERRQPESKSTKKKSNKR